jgi:hypothetical protein
MKLAVPAKLKMPKPKNYQADEIKLRESLILHVQDNPPIWDISSESYHKANVISNCWEAVLDEMTETFDLDLLKEHHMAQVGQLKDLWQNLRTQFRRYRQLTTGKSGAGLADVATKKWPFYDQMCFLNQAVVVYPTQNSMVFQIEEAPGNQTFGPSGDKSGPSTQTITLCEPDVEDIAREADNTTSSTWTPAKQRRKGKYPHSDKEKIMSEREKRNEAYLSAVATLCNYDASDEDVAFGSYIATQLKKIPAEAKLECHAKIIAVIQSMQ